MPAPSTPEGTALEHLRIIRTLMERASLYRAVSASAALVGGALSLVVAFAGVKLSAPGSGAVHSREFLFTWLGVLMLSGLTNLVLLMREAGGKGQPFITEGLRMALRALMPPLITGGVLGVCLIWFKEQLELAVLIWILCYGLALQATVSFAPRGIIRLARAFLITGQLLTVFWFAVGSAGFFQRPEHVASVFMGLTFGLFHIVYGIAVSLGKSRQPA